MKTKANKIIEICKNSENIVIVGHKNIDADCIGSEIAFYNLIKKINKRVYIVNEDITPEGLLFIKGAEKIENNLKIKNVDTLVIIDLSEKQRIGKFHYLTDRANKIIVIDHHLNGSLKGDINIILPKKSSTAEIIYDIYKCLEKKISRKTATALLTGICLDTRCFCQSNTTPYVLRISSELLKISRIDVNYIYQKLYENFSLKRLKLLSELLGNIIVKEDIIIGTVKQKDYKKYNCDYNDSDTFINYLRLYNEANIIILFRETEKKTTKVTFRLKTDVVDLIKIVQKYKGGGHKLAAGCSIKLPIEQAIKTILKDIKENRR